MTEKKTKWIIFGALSFVVWLVYFITTSPTIVFWDVGEFLACSVIFGVPHPPGTPLYVVLGRFLTVLPLPLAPVYKVLTGSSAVNNVLKITMVSMAGGGLTAGFIYLITYETIKLWKVDFPDHYAHMAGIFGGIIGALARTVWMNSIEAETYTPSVFVVAFLVWVALKWYKERERSDSRRYLLFSIYVLFLSSGIHLMPLVYFPVLFFFVWIVEAKKLWDLEFLGVSGIGGIILSTIEIMYEPGLKWYVIFGISIVMVYYYLEKRGVLKSESNEVIGGALGIGVAIFGMIAKSPHVVWIGSLGGVIFIYWGSRLYRDWKGMALILMIIGLSLELVLILRAIHNPYINEADPSNFRAFMDVLTRKQYGPGGVFPRSIPWIDQFKVYWLYWSWQYKALLIPITILGIFGIITHWENDRKAFALVGGTFIIFSLGLLVYLNLKDSPTHAIHAWNAREVRDRDYFYAGAYTFFGLYAGIGLWEVLRLLWTNIKKNGIVTSVLGYGLAGIFVVSQAKTFYPLVNRNHNYVASDYGYDLLISPKGRSVLFTNGDNDTFPLWADQQVLKVRPDVVIANLSYLNTNWYCKQLKQKGAPISFSDSTIDKLPPAIRARDGSILYFRDIMIRNMIATSSNYIPSEYINTEFGRIPSVYFDSGKEFARKVIDGANFRVPLYFSITCDHSAYKGWEKYLILKGLAMEVTDTENKENIAGLTGGEKIDRTYTKELLYDNLNAAEFIKKYGGVPYPGRAFRYRGMFDKKVFKDISHQKAMRNFVSVAVRLAIAFENDGDVNNALQTWRFAKILLSNCKLDEDRLKKMYVALILRITSIRYMIGDYKKAISTAREGIGIVKIPEFYDIMGKSFLKLGESDTALKYLSMAGNMGSFDADSTRIIYYMQKGDTLIAQKIYKKWMSIKQNKFFDSLLNKGG